MMDGDGLGRCATHAEALACALTSIRQASARCPVEVLDQDPSGEVTCVAATLSSKPATTRDAEVTNGVLRGLSNADALKLTRAGSTVELGLGQRLYEPGSRIESLRFSEFQLIESHQSATCRSAHPAKRRPGRPRRGASTLGQRLAWRPGTQRRTPDGRTHALRLWTQPHDAATQTRGGSSGAFRSAPSWSGCGCAQRSAIPSSLEAVEALIAGLRGSGKPLLYTSGTGVLGDTGREVYDENTPIAPSPLPSVQGLQKRLEIEQRVLTAEGVRGVVLRPPNVYGRGDGRAVFWMIRAAAQKLGAVPYDAESGDNVWAFVHVEDLADLFVLALEKAPAGELFHAGAQAGLRTKDVAAGVSRGAGLDWRTVALTRGELADAIGFPPMADYWSSNSQSSSDKARRVLGWTPKHVDLLGEVAQPPA